MIFNHVISEEDGSPFRAYVARPEAGKGPGLILLHEVYGVNENLKMLADDFAAKGYVVYCPNMYWHHNPDASFRPQGPGEEMTDDLARQREEARDLMYNKFDYDLLPADISTVVEAMKVDESCTGKIGAMGFCLGGKNAYLASVNGLVDAGVMFYPTPSLKDVFSMTDALGAKTPMMFIVGGQDPYITPAEKADMVNAAGRTAYYVPGLREAMQVKKPDGNQHISTLYFGASGHAFGRKASKHYDEPVADHVYRLVDEFLGSSLAQQSRAYEVPNVLMTPDSPSYLPVPKK